VIRRRRALVTRTPLRRRTPLAQMSPKRRSEQRARADCRAVVLERDGGCLAAIFGNCAGPLDVDEIVSRGRGGSYLDPNNCQTLCRRHHEAKHHRIHAASILGLWGMHAFAMHVRQELGESAPVDDIVSLHEWAVAEYNR